MKLTKADYMRLPKERLAELLVEADSLSVQPIVLPSEPKITEPAQPYNPLNPYPWGGPIITYMSGKSTTAGITKEEK